MPFLFVRVFGKLQKRDVHGIHAIDKRLIKSFIPSVFVRASMVQMSPSCELTYYVSVLCSFISVGIPHVLSLRPLLYCLPPPRRRRGLRLNNAT